MVLPLVLIGGGLLVLGILVAVLVLGNLPGTAAGNSPVVKPAELNQPAPDLSLSDLQARPASLLDYRGQVILVNNWATWCPPCKAEMPILQRYFDEHQDEGFALIAIESGSPLSEVEAYIQQAGLTFPVWIDLEQRALAAFNQFSLPSSFVIDRSGTVRLAWLGATDIESLETYVTPLLEE